MLVLSRKVGEEVIIGDNIRVTVVAINGNHVRLGFEAPRDVHIYRQELAESAHAAPRELAAAAGHGR